MPRDLLLVTLSLFTWGIGEGMFIYFQSLYLQEWGANPVAIGAILGVSGIAMTVTQVPAGYLADRIGRRPVMWFSWILGAISTLIMALAGSLPVFVAGLVIYGLTSAVLAPMNSYITGARGKWSVGRALTWTSAMYNLGMVIGPTVGGIIAEKSSLHTVYWISAVIFMVSTAIILFVRSQPIEHHPAETHTRLFQNRAFIGYLGVVFITILAIYLPQPLTPNFLQNERGLSLSAVGQMGSIASLGSAVITLAFGHLSPNRGYLLGQALVAVFAVFMWKGSGLLGFGLGYFFLGGYRLSRSMSIAQARSLIHPAEMGLAYGAIETVNASAFILGPIIAGIVYDWNPVGMYPLTLGLIAVSIVAGTAYALRRRVTASTAGVSPD
ncbi:MAG TPA: MFS transporter [Anaerolineaceae bacterium]|nr:MFS transporter [Anaerolineaceae bacterium]